MPDNRLEGKKVLLVVPKTQFREEEVFEPKRILEKEGASVVVASGAAGVCHGMRTGVIDADVAISEAQTETYDALVLAGGSSVPELFWKDKKLLGLVTAAAEAGRVVAAIDLSAVVLAKARLLEGKQATVYYLPEAIDELKKGGAAYTHQQVLVTDKVITAEGPAAATAFGDALVDALTS